MESMYRNRNKKDDRDSQIGINLSDTYIYTEKYTSEFRQNGRSALTLIVQ